MCRPHSYPTGLTVDPERTQTIANKTTLLQRRTVHLNELSLTVDRK